VGSSPIGIARSGPWAQTFYPIKPLSYFIFKPLLR